MSPRRVTGAAGGLVGVFNEMRVWPLTWRNIWNTYINIENIYKKHIDKQLSLSLMTRTPLEHTGTFFRELFRKCSGNPFFRNTPQSLIDQGLQPIREKSCSTMFRLAAIKASLAVSHRIKGL